MGDHQRLVSSTADEAILAKQAAVMAGYYDDPYIEPFARTTRAPRHFQPIIKRGTHARVCCVDRAISAFLNLPHEGRKQVVLLGAGKDTAYFRHRAKTTKEESSMCGWFEVDQSTVIESKAHIVRKSKARLQTTIQQTEAGYALQGRHGGLICDLIGHDLCSPTSQLFAVLEKTSRFDTTAATLFVFECVLMYLPEQSSRELLQGLSQACPNSYLCCYEPVLGSDAFGSIMEKNLTRARIISEEACIRKTRTLSAQLEKVSQCGFTSGVACDMAAAYDTVLTKEDRERARKAEFLDELEEWLLIMQHYCLVICCTENSLLAALYCAIGEDSPMGFLAGKCQSTGLK